jgi:hypothetical protein
LNYGLWWSGLNRFLLRPEKDAYADEHTKHGNYGNDEVGLVFHRLKTPIDQDYDAKPIRAVTSCAK